MAIKQIVTTAVAGAAGGAIGYGIYTLATGKPGTGVLSSALLGAAAGLAIKLWQTRNEF